ncbi:MAG: DUF1963 domain-containing protein [Okeania sp. SIO3B5]|nr:DUF1963 domain-containing protein [Okeania sp. SIO3B5]NEO53662.1 DUF1963 domain-containing protein [Okeania sp. SIO3B5]
MCTCLRDEFNLSFTHYYSPVHTNDAAFNRYFPNFNYDNLLDIYSLWFSQYFWININQHNLEGYPDFTQEYSRFNPEYEDCILLLQID